MKTVWEIESTIDGFRLNIWPEDITQSVYKINPETRLEALSVILRNIQEEIQKEEKLLRDAVNLG